MKNYQKGFSAVEALLILVIVGVIGGVGYFVYSSQKKTNEALENAAKVSSSVYASTKTETKPVAESEIYVDWKSFSKNGYVFKYPDDWTLLEGQPFGTVTSPDFKSTGVQSRTVTSGIMVYFDQTDIPQTNITADSYKSSTLYSPTYSNFEKKSINDKAVVRYHISDNIIRTVFFKNDGIRIGVQTEFATENKDANLKTYDLILASVKY
jgi:hypothetical protein